MPKMKKKLITEIERNKELMGVGDDYENLPKINDTYPNIDFHERTKNDRLNPKLLNDIQTAAAKAGIIATVNYARTGHDKYTDSGAISRHWTGLGLDISQIQGLAWGSKTDAENKEILDDIEKFVKNLEDLGYARNNEIGQDKAFLYFGVKNHGDHVHVSNTDIEGVKSGKVVWTNPKSKGKVVWTNPKSKNEK